MDLGALAPFGFVLICPVAMFLLMRFGMGASGRADPKLAQLTPAERLARLERQRGELTEAIVAAKAETERGPAGDHVPTR